MTKAMVEKRYGKSTMVEKLEEKTRAPRVVLCDRYRLLHTDRYGCGFYIDGSIDDGFFRGCFSLNRFSLDGVYDANLTPLWKNENLSVHQPAKPEDTYSGLQIAFTDSVIYEGESWRGHRFTLLDLPHAEEDYRQGKYFRGLTIPRSFVKVIFDYGGNPVWEGWKNK